MARSKFRTRFGRIRHHSMRTRHAIHHHGFRTRYHRAVTGGRVLGRKHALLKREHVPHTRSVHAGIVIKTKAKAAAKARIARASKSRVKLSHTKIAGGRKVSTNRRHVTAVHAVAGPRHMSAAARANLSRALTGKKHPHKGHAMSAATRAKISASVSKRLKGRPHPHKGHAMSSTARKKISKALTGKKHPHRAAKRKKR